MRIECPSGLTGEVRGLTVGEVGLLANRRESRAQDPTDRILQNNWIETVDPGPYSLKDGNMVWPKALTADRFYASIMIRVATHGPEYEFRVPCTSCQESIDWVLNLTELPLKKVPDKSLEAFKSGEPLETRIAGKVVRFRLQSGDLERRAQRAVRNAKDPMSAILAQQIIEVQGEPNKFRWVQNLLLPDGLALRDEFDAQDGGVETEIDIICDFCGVERGIELPLALQDFWMPSKRVRRRKRTQAR